MLASSSAAISINCFIFRRAFKEACMQYCYCKYIIPTVHTDVESVALDNFSLKVMESVIASPARSGSAAIKKSGRAVGGRQTSEGQLRRVCQKPFARQSANWFCKIRLRNAAEECAPKED
jgi:hypothetical protein